MVKIVKFGQNCEIWSKLWNLVDIVKFGQNSEIWSEFWKFGWSFENSWFAMVGIVMNVGRGYVIQHHEWIN